jgi:hypothetical protein
MTVIQLTNSVCGAELQNNVRQAATELASVQAGCKVHTLFRPSVVDLESGKHGVRWLIARILTEIGATKRNGAVTAKTVIDFVRAINGPDKYPPHTIRQNLSVVMKRAGQVKCFTGAACGRGQPPKLYYYVADNTAE